MQAKQTIGIDLPLKVLVWRDESGATWLSYNDPVWLAERHGIMPESADTLRQMSATLANLAAVATYSRRVPAFAKLIEDDGGDGGLSHPASLRFRGP